MDAAREYLEASWGWPEQIVMKVGKVGDVRETRLQGRLRSSNLQVKVEA